jgi:hypothetical protein
MKRATRFVPIVVGMLEFVLCAMMFLMAAFALTGYLVVSYNRMGDTATAIESDIGLLAVAAFVFGLAGSVSAIKRWSLFLSVFGASFIACWGLLQIWYSLTFLVAISDVSTGVILGTFALFFSMLVIILVVAAREHFKPHALARAML